MNSNMKCCSLPKCMTFRHIKRAAIKKEKMFIKNLQKHLSYSYPPLSIKNKRSIKNQKVPMPNFFMSQDQVCFFGSILTYLGHNRLLLEHRSPSWPARWKTSVYVAWLHWDAKWGSNTTDRIKPRQFKSLTIEIFLLIKYFWIPVGNFCGHFSFDIFRL